MVKKAELAYEVRPGGTPHCDTPTTPPIQLGFYWFMPCQWVVVLALAIMLLTRTRTRIARVGFNQRPGRLAIDWNHWLAEPIRVGEWLCDIGLVRSIGC